MLIIPEIYDPSPEEAVIVASMLAQNAQRNEAFDETLFDPVSGKGSPGERFVFDVSGIPLMYLPIEMKGLELISGLEKAGSLSAYIRELSEYELLGEESDEESVEDLVLESLVRLRSLYDFPFWCSTLAYIKPKGGGDDVPFRLNYPQRQLLVPALEKMRKEGQPIRLVLLKARQWGGSTCVQNYMAWLQLVHKTGLNSLIVGHVKDASNEVRDMFDRLLDHYPASLLHSIGEDYEEDEQKVENVGASSNTKRVISRKCKIKIATAERPNSARGGDYNLVHCTEVGLWTATEGKTPEDIVRTACSGVLLMPYTMIVYESTANGTGNFFEREYVAAKKGESQFKSLFVAWFQIPMYRSTLSEREQKILALNLLREQQSDYSGSNKRDPGRYLWYLWEIGATLEGIAWYMSERTKFADHGDMASEYPSDDDEAFNYSGFKVFDKLQVKHLEKSCKPSVWRGELVGSSDSDNPECLKNLKFVADSTGCLEVWCKPERKPRFSNRYLVVVDVGGRSRNADYSVIWVVDRLLMSEEGGKPETVAQWYGHCDMDVLAWKAAQIAKWYDNALLVIESNTLETKSRERSEGDHSRYILHEIRDHYDNLYAREQSEEDIRVGAPLKYGFHTNVGNKGKIIDHLVRMVRLKLYTERDVRCLDEMLTYEQKQNGSYGAIVGKHDDILMTRAIGLYICYNTRVMPLPKLVERNKDLALRRRAISEATI